MKQLMIVIGVMMAVAQGCDTAGQERKDNTAVQQAVVVKKIHTQELKEMLKNKEEFQLVDIRTPQETAQGTIAGAREINFFDNDFASKMDELDKEKPLVVYCASGGRSAKAVSVLKEKGFKHIIDYTDGYTGWVRDN